MKQSAASTATVHLTRDGNATVFHVHDGGLVISRMGLESAPTEYERRDLVLRELQRTGAFDRELLMVISPTGTGYVNYVAVEAAEYLTRGNIVSVTMQYSLRAPGRAVRTMRIAQPRMTGWACHARLDGLPEGHQRTCRRG